MYATSGTNIYAMDLATGVLGTAVSFAGQGISAAYGATVATAAVPVPGAALLFASGLLGFARFGTRSSA